MSGWKSRPKEFRQMWEYSVGFYGVWVAHIGRRMGLFEAIVRRPASSDALAVRKGLDRNALSAWCSAASSLGFLKTKGKNSTYLHA